MGEVCEKLESIGADFVVLSANTPHIVFDEVRKKVNVQMISIVEATYEKAQELGLKNVGLLGTKFTMEHDSLKNHFFRSTRKLLFQVTTISSLFTRDLLMS